MNRYPTFPWIHALLATVVGVGISPSLFAQTNPNRDAQIRGQELREKALPGLRDGQAPQDEADEGDFGDLLFLKRSKSWYVTPYSSANGYWTSNALLTNKGEKGDTILVANTGMDTGYRINKDWNLRAGYNFQVTRYSENPNLDTDADSAYFTSTWNIPWNFQVAAGVRGLWMSSPQQNEEIYRENNPYGSLSQSWTFLEERLNVFYGYQYGHKFTNPVGFERDEHTVFGGISYAWLPNVLTQMMLQQNWQFYDFRAAENPVNGRQEWISTLVLQTVWQPLDWLQLSAFGIASYDNSVNASRDYKVANAGGEVRVFWKF